MTAVQAAQADAALALLQGQLQRQKHQEGGGLRERAELLQVQLDAEEKRSRQLEENLKLQVQQSRSQFSMKQVKQRRGLLLPQNPPGTERLVSVLRSGTVREGDVRPAAASGRLGGQAERSPSGSAGEGPGAPRAGGSSGGLGGDRWSRCF